MAQGEEIQQKLQKKRNRELVAYFKELVGKEGLAAALRRTASYVKRRYGAKKGRFLPKKTVLTLQSATDMAGWPLISICVPVYNVSPGFFEALLCSVRAQSNPHWQLCLADASEDASVVANILAKHNDRRIVCVKVDNKGIAANTNRAAELAQGSYIALLDHDDVLAPNAVFEVAKAAHETGAEFLYSDEALFAKTILRPSAGHFKPDYSPQYLLNCNYIAHFTALTRALFHELGGLQSKYDGSQDHDLFLRALEKTSRVVHIPKVLYYWRQHEASTSLGVGAKPYVREAAIGAINEHLARTGVRGEAVDGLFPSTYKVNYVLRGQPLVSIVIPSHDHAEDLEKCLCSIYTKTAYPHFEVVVVENNSAEPATFAYYDRLKTMYPRCRVVVCALEHGFNFSKICNFGREQATGEFILFLNNDTEVINPEWLAEMLQLCQLVKVGVVGAMLYYPDDTVQHAGVIVGLGGYAGHSHKYAGRWRSGYMFRQACVQELSAVTGACLMVKTSVFDAISGFDEQFTVAYNDVDFCLRVGNAGYSVVFTPYAQLYHYESKSRGSDEQGSAKQRFEREQTLLKERYGDSLLRDPYYNPNLTYDREDFSESDILPEA